MKMQKFRPASVIATLSIAAIAVATAVPSCNGTTTPTGAVVPAPQTASKPRQYKIVPPTVYPGAVVQFPPLGTFVQGPERKEFEKGRIYVFEFFSTTCGHCAEAAPIIEALVEDYTPKGFEFISVTAEDEAKVREWLAKPEIAQVTTQSIALDPGSKTQKKLQDPTYQILTPRFFVIRDGMVLWFGHPDAAEEPFKKIAAGTWNPMDVKAEFITNSLVARAKNQTSGLLTQCEKDGKWKDLLDLYESIAVAIPERASTFELQKFGTMIGPADMSDEGYSYGRILATKYATDIASLRTLARTTLNSPQVKKRDIEWAFEIAKAADALGKGEEPRAAEIMALAYFSKGDREKAIENAERAIRLQDNVKLRKIYETQLEKYRKDEPKPVPYTPRVQPAPAAKPAPEATTPPQGNDVAVDTVNH
jgi:thiol-disulfide isomerase/thioredoxin